MRKKISMFVCMAMLFTVSTGFLQYGAEEIQPKASAQSTVVSGSQTCGRQVSLGSIGYGISCSPAVKQGARSSNYTVETGVSASYDITSAIATTQDGVTRSGSTYAKAKSATSFSSGKTLTGYHTGSAGN